MTDKVIVSGMGLCSPLGNQLDDFWSAIINKQSAAKSWDDLKAEGFRYSSACRIEEDYGKRRGAKMAIAAVKSALEMSKIDLAEKSVAIVVGSTLGESSSYESIAERQETVDQFPNCMDFAKTISKELGIKALCRAYGTACAAGNYAIHAGMQLLISRKVDIAIVGGVDPFSRIAMAGFSRSRAMSNKGHCKPFDAERSGMLLGEGAGFLILERATDCLARGGTPLAVASGAGFSSDAYHPTAPAKDGKGMRAAMKTAIRSSKLSPDQISWVCAHGSGTRLSDQIEADAIAHVFSQEQMPCAGIKGAIGHSLGAATAIESILCILSIQKQVIPPTVGFEKSDPGIPIQIFTEAQSRRVKSVLNAGYAFGGINSALIFEQWN